MNRRHNRRTDRQSGCPIFAAHFAAKVGIVRSTTALFSQPTTDRSQQEAPAVRPIRTLLPEGEAILQPPMDNTPNDAPEGAPSRIPHIGHALLFLAITGAILLLTQLIAGTLAGHAHHTVAQTAASAANPTSTADSMESPKLIIGAEVFTYVATLGLSWFLFPLLWQRSFASGLQLNPPAAGRNALKLVPLGITLSFVVQAFSSLITMPKEIPMDDFFRTRTDVWIITAFGVLLAPLFEEILFRGFLLPAFAIAYDWLSLPRSEAALATWRSSNKITTPAWAFAAILSSIFFTALHGQQVAFAWPVLILLFCVSLILTAIRLRLRSVFASALVHASYNFAIFLTAFIGTDGYRHLDKLTH